MNINLKLVKSGFDSVREDYTAIVVANGKTTQEDLIAAVNKAEPHISKISAEQVLATQLAFIGAMLAEGNYVNMGGIGLSPYVEGSLLHADEEVTSDMLGIEVRVYDGEYLEAIKSLDVTTTIDEDSLPFNFTKVEDSATSDFGTVTPGYEFMPIGDKLSQGLDGERIEITDKAGTTKVINDATGSSNGMWLKATCPEGLVAGKGKIAVYSRGLKTPEGAISHISRAITILAGETKGEPKIVSMISEKSGKAGVSYGWEDTFVITLENCTTEGAKVRRVLIDDDGEIDAETAWDSEYTSVEIVSPTVLKFKVVANDTREPSENWRTMYHAFTEVMLADGKVLSAPMSFDEGED